MCPWSPSAESSLFPPDIERLFEEKSIASFGIHLSSSDSQFDARSGGRACFGMHQSVVQLALRIERPICRSGVMHGLSLQRPILHGPSAVFQSYMWAQDDDFL